MRIAGLQKLTLLDYPGMMACTVFTAGCAFRCPFCHNASLVLPERQADVLREEEVLAFLEKRRGVLEGVAVTGGEPLLHEDLGLFLARVKAMGYRVKLDTNGQFPDHLKRLVKAGLIDRVAMDIKNAPERYGESIGLPDFDLSPVEQSRDFLLAGSVPYEFRTTVVKGLHTKESLLSAARWIAGAREYYLQQYRDSGDVLCADGLDAFSEDEMRGLCAAVKEYVPTACVRGI